MRMLVRWGLCVVIAPCPVRILAAQEHTTVGGYGEVHYTNPTGPKTPAVVTLARFVVYLAHSFDDRLAFRSELEVRSEEHTSELQSHLNIVCRLLLEKKKKQNSTSIIKTKKKKKKEKKKQYTKK